MHVEYLDFFLDVAQTMSISKTAHNFYMSPQGISRAIHSLEEYFDVSLLDRKGNNISLTPAGHDFVVNAREVKDHLEQLHKAMAGYSHSQQCYDGSCVNLYATQFIFNYVFPLMAGGMLKKMFPLPVRTVESNIYRMVSAIEEDCSPNTIWLVSQPHIDEVQQELMNIRFYKEDIRSEPLLQTTLMAEISSSSPLAAKKKISLEDIKANPVVCFSDHVLIRCLNTIIGEKNITFISNNSELIHHYIVQDHAIAFVPSLVKIKGLAPGTTVREFEKSYKVDLGFIFKKGVELAEEGKAVYEIIKKFFLQLGAKNEIL